MEPDISNIGQLRRVSRTSAGRQGAGTRSNLSLTGNRLRGWSTSFPAAPDRTGNADMNCPEECYYDSAACVSQGSAYGFRPGACRLNDRRVLQVTWRLRQKAGSRFYRAIRRAVCCVLPHESLSPSGSAFPHSPSQQLREMVLRRSGSASMSSCWTSRDGLGLLTFTADRVSNVQQNAHRCVAPRRNQGGRCSR